MTARRIVLIDRFFEDVVKTRMQLDTGKTSVGLVGSLRAIVAQEGLVTFIYSILFIFHVCVTVYVNPFSRIGRLYRGTNLAIEE